MIGIEATNTDEQISKLQDVLDKLPDVHQAIAERAIEKSKEEVQSNLYPGHGYDTGLLHGSYGGELEEPGESSARWTFGSGVFYDPYVEFCWGGRCSHFRPMLEVLKSEMPTIMDEEYKKVLE